MNYKHVVALFVAAVISAGSLWSQITLNPNPSRVVGHAKLTLSTSNPNLVEGRELYAPQGVALDTSASPPILYVSDTGNNRVLAWRNAAQFSNGAPADLIIGQRDKYSTFALGPGTTFSVGLNSPTGLAVRDGNLYVVDSGNNRILRFPSPFAQTDQFPDLVIGQPNFTSRLANQGGTLPTEKTLYLAGAAGVFRATLAFDSSGYLWAVDPGNNRVLRFKPGLSENFPSADLVIGQADFVSVAQAMQATVNSQQVKDRLQVPAGVAFDGAGRLWVSDSLNRVLVFAPPFFSGMLARRVMGVVIPPKQGERPIPQITYDRTLMADPEGIFFADGNFPAVIDSLSSRILVFDPFEQWPDEATTYSPLARSVIGQNSDFTSRKVNNGLPEPTGATLSGPVAAALAGGELYVVDSGNHRVLVMPADSGGVFRPAVRVAGQDGLALNSPNLIEGREFQFSVISSRGVASDAGFAVDSTTDVPRLYVADTYNNRVLGFKDARKVRPGDKADIVIGQPDMARALCNYPDNDADKPNQKSLCRPTGIAVDAEGNLWVADSGNGRVLRFPAPFAHQATLPAADLVIGQKTFTAKLTDPTSSTMAAPYGITFAAENGLLVSDATHNRVLFFPRQNGTFTTGMAAAKVFGQPDFTSSLTSSSGSPEDYRMNAPHHLAVDSDGRTYVADTGNNRVLIFDTLVNTPASDAHAAVILSAPAPRAVYVSPRTGEIWVSDTSNRRALRFPRFDQLAPADFKANASIPAAAAIVALTQDSYGNLYVADASNRVAIHYPGLVALNGANFMVNRALAPGMVASIYPLGNQFGQETKSFSELANPLPMPTELADIQVLVNDQPAPLFFVSPGQINLLVPSSSPTSGTAEFQVLRKSTGQILGSAPVAMNIASPALFTMNSTGSGQVAALNEDGSVNSPTNPAARGSVIALFGTGQGPVAGGPPDGEPAPGPVSTSDNPRVFIGSCYVDEPQCMDGEGNQLIYSGLAPGLVGVWQINVRIPKATAPDNNTVVLLYYRSVYSGQAPQVRTTIAVK
ncbi:MAG: hypothetical protein ACE15B_10940 [Bryobacteraceae bacterium]